MSGIFGKIFDLNHDGKMSLAEKTFEIACLNRGCMLRLLFFSCFFYKIIYIFSAESFGLAGECSAAYNIMPLTHFLTGSTYYWVLPVFPHMKNCLTFKSIILYSYKSRKGVSEC